MWASPSSRFILSTADRVADRVVVINLVEPLPPGAALARAGIDGQELCMLAREAGEGPLEPAPSSCIITVADALDDVADRELHACSRASPARPGPLRHVCCFSSTFPEPHECQFYRKGRRGSR